MKTYIKNQPNFFIESGLIIGLLFISLILISGIGGCAPANQSSETSENSGIGLMPCNSTYDLIGGGTMQGVFCDMNFSLCSGTFISSSDVGNDCCLGTCSAEESQVYDAQSQTNSEIIQKCDELTDNSLKSLCKGCADYSLGKGNLYDALACVGIAFKNTKIAEDFAKKSGYTTENKGLNYYLALLNKNEAFCGIDDEMDRSYYSSCFRNIALLKNDAGICNKIKNSEEKSLCYEMVAVLNNDPKSCEFTRFPEICYKDVATINKDKNFCGTQSASGESNRGKCYRDLAIATGDESLCMPAAIPSLYYYLPEDCIATIKLEADKCETWECYYHIALNKSDSSLCEKISKELENAQPEIMDCYTKIAASTRNKNDCHNDKICLYNLALLNKDVELCKSIAIDNMLWIGGINSEVSIPECYLNFILIAQNPSFSEELSKIKVIGKPFI